MKKFVLAAVSAAILGGCAAHQGDMQNSGAIVDTMPDSQSLASVVVGNIDKPEQFNEAPVPYEMQHDNKDADGIDGVSSDIPFNANITVFFGFDKFQVTQKQEPVLQKNVEWLRDHPGNKVVLEGYTDQMGSPEYNIALGERRARSVMEYFQSNGIPESQMDYMSYGEEKPLVFNPTKQQSYLNRRVVIRYVTNDTQNNQGDEADY